MRKILTLFLVAAFVVMIAAPVSAQDYVYMGENDNLQVPGQPHRGFTYYQWASYSIFYPDSSYHYYRDLRWGTTSGSQMRDIMQEAFDRWYDYIDNPLGIDWHSVTYSTGSASSWNLRGYLSACPSSPSARGCVSYDEFLLASPGNIANWSKGRMYIHPSHPIDEKEDTATHELGHMYGLADRYLSGGSCNPNEYTVMDSSPCDGGYPSATDVSRMNYFDTYGGTYQIIYTVQSNRTMYTAWRDQTWNGLMARFLRYKWVGVSWVYQETVEDYFNIGTHYDSDPRTIYHNWTTPGGGYWYKICAKEWVGTQNNGFQVESYPGCSAGMFIY